MAGSSQDDFDGYRKWLGITSRVRPPDHYALLGIGIDEEDDEVIQAAIDQRRQFVESKRGQGHDDSVAEILYQIGEAEVTLFNVEMRRKYDRQMNLWEKRRKSRQVDPNSSRSRVKSRPGRAVGEGGGIAKTFVGIMALVCIAFGIMAWFSFQLPWSKRSDQVNAAPTAQAPIPAQNQVAQVQAAEPNPVRAVAPPIDERVGELFTFKGHTGGVWSVAISPDGKTAASGQGIVLGILGNGDVGPPKEYVVLVWDVETGHELQRFTGHTDTIRSVAFSPDGKRIVSGSWDKTIRIWDVKAGTVIHRIEGLSDKIVAVTFTTDGNKIVSGGIDKTIRIWDANTGTQLKTIGAKGQVHTLSLSPDGQRLLTGELNVNEKNDDTFMSLWDFKSGNLIRRFSGVKGINTLSFSQDGRRVLSAGLVGEQESIMQLWDVETGDEIKKFDGLAACFLPDGKRAFAASKDKPLILWNSETGDEAWRFNRHEGAFCVAISSDGRRALSGGFDKTVKVWGLPKDPRAPEPTKLIEPTEKEIAHWKFWDALKGKTKKDFIIVSRDGVLVSPAGEKGYCLSTLKEFSDLELKIEYQLQRGDNLGNVFVAIASTLPNPPPATDDWTKKIPYGIEVKLDPNIAGALVLPSDEFKVKLVDGQQRDGRHIKPLKPTDVRISEWNTLEIKVDKDRKMVAKINGLPVNRLEDIQNIKGHIVIWLPLCEMRLRNAVAISGGVETKLSFDNIE